MSIDWSAGLPLRIGNVMIGLTETSPETAGYWQGVMRHELMIKVCMHCHRYLYPRRLLCPECGSEALEWLRAKGTGTVYTFSTVYRAPSDDFETPYSNGLIELDEGVHVFGRLIGKAHELISIGDRVQVEFGELRPSGGVLPVYRIM
jgi:uncharacterized OB-fold protein